MEAIIFIGIPASGKSTFYNVNFLNSHYLISNDLLNKKNEEWKLIDFCLETNKNMVIDNTNYSKEKRLAYIDIIKPYNFNIIGYFFDIDVNRSIKWNKEREQSKIIPDVAIRTINKKIEKPKLSEGYDKLFHIVYIRNKLIIKDYVD